MSTYHSSSSFTTTSTFSSYSSAVPLAAYIGQKEDTVDGQYGTVPAAENIETNKARYCSCCKTFAVHLSLSIGLTLGTYVGVSGRIGLTVFSKWDGVIHFPSFWAQVIGTFIIGAAVGQKHNLQGSLYTLITTGVCGSMTTFSSWNVEASKVLLQLNDSTLEPIHNSIDGGRIVGFLTVLMLGVGMPVSMFYLGKNISSSIPVRNNSQDNEEQGLQSSRVRWSVLLMVNIVVFLFVTSVIITACVYTQHYNLLFALLLGGPGTYIRWRLGVSLDKTKLKYIGNFPIGTFCANILGSIVLAIVLVSISYCSNVVTIGVIPLAVLKGIAVGFCGSLTTVSSFVSQICSLPFHMSACYALLSLIVSQFLINAVFLSYQALI